MLETFRKHHYILMCFVAVAVIIAFTFLGNPTDRGGGPAGSSQRVGTLYNKEFTLGEVQTIGQLGSVLGRLQMLNPSPGGSDPVGDYLNTMGSIVNTMASTNREEIDMDYPVNVFVLRKEAETLGIEVEREDLEKFIKDIPAFHTGGAFDASKLESFLTSGFQGDRAAMETKLLTALRDVMIFQRLAKLVGGSYAPSPAEIDASYAEIHQLTTAATVLIDRKAHENQTVTDEDVQKFYDAEKAKQEAVAAEKKKREEAIAKNETPPARNPEVVEADPMVLSEEKRTVKYVFTEVPPAPVAPLPPGPAPQAPAALPPLEDLSALPEDQKKAKEEEYKKRQEEHAKAEEEYKKKQEEFTKATADFPKLQAEHETKVKEYTATRDAWLRNVSDFSDALNADGREKRTFEEIAQSYKFEVKTASFTKTAPPDDLKKMRIAAGRGQSGAAMAIFDTPKDSGEVFIEDRNLPAYAFYVVTGIEEAAMLPLDQVKQKISDKLKADKVASALKAAAESARSNILEALKAGKSIKDAAAAAMLTAAELPAFSARKALPPGTPNAGVVLGAVSGRGSAGLNAGEMSQPLEVPEGLLLVYVEKKELPKAPDMDQQKKEFASERTFRGAVIAGSYVNPVLKAWFTARRSEAQTIAQ